MTGLEGKQKSRNGTMQNFRTFAPASTEGKFLPEYSVKHLENMQKIATEKLHKKIKKRSKSPKLKLKKAQDILMGHSNSFEIKRCSKS